MYRLKSDFGGYLRNHDRLRRKTFKIATDVEFYAQSEHLPYASVLNSIADRIRQKETHRDILMQRVQNLCKDRCKLYSEICGKLKKDIREYNGILEDERRKKKTLEKTMLNEAENAAKIGQSAVANAIEASKRAVDAVDVQAVQFDSQRQNDIQTILNEFVWSELQYHAKALESLTLVHQSISTLPSPPPPLEIMSKQQNSPTAISSLPSPTLSIR